MPRKRPLAVLCGFTATLAAPMLGAPGGLIASAGAATPPTQQPGTAAPAPTPAQQPAPTPASPTAEISLSNEHTLTTWAHPQEPGAIYATPEAHGRRVGSIHMETEDGFAEVYLLLDSYVDPHGHEWVQLRIPGRPNGRVGWTPRTLLGEFRQTRWSIVVDLDLRRLTAYFDGRLRMSAPVGVGKPSTPTPAGHFWIRERFRLMNRSNPYWPYALGTSDYSMLSEWPGGGVVGIHGDFGEPNKIPGDPSHGCVRMRDSDIARLAPLVTLGTPVDIIR